MWRGGPPRIRTSLSRDQVIEISNRFASLNPYSFGATILKIEDVNYIDGDPSKGFRNLYG